MGDTVSFLKFITAYQIVLLCEKLFCLFVSLFVNLFLKMIQSRTEVLFRELAGDWRERKGYHRYTGMGTRLHLRNTFASAFAL